MPYQLDGVTLKPGRPFETNDGTQYPGDWLNQSTPVDRAELGIDWVEPAVQPYYDQRFYWGPNNPKDLDELKALWVSKQKKTAVSLLAPTDWYVIRMGEDPTCMCPLPVKTYRAAVRQVSDNREDQINACLTTDELASLITNQVTELDPNPVTLERWPDELS